MSLVVFFVVLGAALVLAAAGLTLWLVARTRRSRARLAGELARDPAVRGPEPAIYRGCTGGYSQVMGNGQIALTEQRLLFQKVVGGLVVVPRRTITGVSTAKTFNHSVVGGRTHVVVHTHSGDVAFFVTDMDAWIAALAPEQSQAEPSQAEPS